MKYFQIALLCIICITRSYGQISTRKYGLINVEVTKEKKPKRIYTKIEITGALPGGDSSVIQTLEQKLNQSIKVIHKAKAGKYIVSVSFPLERNGDVTDIQCVKDPGFKICEQVEAVIKKMFCCKWYPQASN